MFYVVESFRPDIVELPVSKLTKSVLHFSSSLVLASQTEELNIRIRQCVFNQVLVCVSILCFDMNSLAYPFFSDFLHTSAHIFKKHFQDEFMTKSDKSLFCNGTNLLLHVLLIKVFCTICRLSLLPFSICGGTFGIFFKLSICSSQPLLWLLQSFFP